MKRVLLALALLLSCTAVYAIDVNVDTTSDLLYTSYIKNEAYNAMASMTTVTAVEAFEKLRLKAKHEIGGAKLNLDTRFYLYSDKSEIDYFIDAAYVSIENGPFVLYAGKQRIKWGTGYFWNPSDKLQKAKNVFRTEENLEGVFSFKADYSFSNITPSIVVVPKNGDNLSYYDIAGQIYILLGTADIYINGIMNINDNYRRLGAALSWDIGFCVLNAEVGQEDGDLPEILLHGMEDMPGSDDTVYDFVAGISKRVTEDLFAVVEYYRHNAGYKKSEYDEMQYYEGFQALFSKQNYLAYSLSYTMANTFGFALTGMHGLDDGTSYIFPSISYVENENWDVQVSLLQNLTQNHMSEGYYAAPVYSTVELRINAYF